MGDTPSLSTTSPSRWIRPQRVRLITVDGDGQAEIWARVAVPFAGASRGALFIPDVDDEVLVTFVAGDPRFPIVIGGLWNGGAPPPETFSGDRVDRWTITSKAGMYKINVDTCTECEGEFDSPQCLDACPAGESCIVYL